MLEALALAAVVPKEALHKDFDKGQVRDLVPDLVPDLDPL